MRKILFLFTICFAQLVHGQYLVPTLDKATGKYGYKEKGKIEWSLDPIYKKAYDFVGNLAIVNDGKYEFVIDFHGKKVSPDFASIRIQSNNNEILPYIGQDRNGYYNIYDSQFNPICKTSYLFMSYLSQFGLLMFRSVDYLCGVMDLEGHILIPPIISVH